ncbi:hypothetical protein N0V90_010006 [Kalmusia sp. IMI 367209]|nr:hypothetical protein N0V90_010006 [Kalmusia sp. IMI 367209]
MDGFGATHYDETACKALQHTWDVGQTLYVFDVFAIPLPHSEKELLTHGPVAFSEPFSGEIMNPYFQNQSCDPWTPASKPCELGNYVSYSISIAEADDVVAGIQFSQEKNVRLVIKNTGHDFLGKSTAKGALGLWTHNLKSTTFIEDYKDAGYSGPAIKLGAGVTGYEAMNAAHAAGYRIVSGDCPTVGIAGGYTQGGGHSPLNGAYGMAADQVLEWEVVTADGEHRNASPTDNIDLYWALSGGGAGTFAVVLSMTVKLYAEGPVGAAEFSFSKVGVDNETYLEAVVAWWRALPDIVDTGATTIWVMSSVGFSFEGFTALDKTADEVTDLLKPFTSTPSYYEHFNNTNGPLPYGNWPASMLFNSNIIPRAVTASSETISKAASTMEDIVNDVSTGQWTLGCHALNVANASHPDNAVAPYWRDAVAICIVISLWDWTIPRSEMLERKTYLAENIVPALDAAIPNMGAYLNEADPYVYPQGSTQWQEIFYGSNYPKLRSIKDKWDPKSVFYAHTAVGSENWTIDTGGRLCKA